MEIKINQAVSRKMLNFFERSPEKFSNTLDDVLFSIGQELRNRAVRLAPFKTGTLRRSITTDVDGNTVHVGSNLEYARIHDQGGRITPKKGKYLTIPLGGTRGRIRSHKGFFIKSKKGNLIFAQSIGKGIKPLFVLKRQVQMPKYKGRGYLTPAFRSIVRGGAKSIIQKQLELFFKT